MHYKDPQNNLHVLDSIEFEHLLPEGSLQITDNEAAEIAAAKVIQPTYSELRRAAYPPIADYIDAHVKQSTELLQKYRDDCMAVKAKYPKPEKI